MIKWMKKLFEPPVDKTELKIKEIFNFLFAEYDFSFAKINLGNLVDKEGNLIFYGPLYAYQIYNDNLCINIVNLVQRQDYDIYITKKPENDQHHIFKGFRLSSYLAYHLQEFAIEIKSELLNSGTICGKKI